MRLDSVFAACSNRVRNQPEPVQMEMTGPSTAKRWLREGNDRGIQDCLRCTRCPKSARVSSRFCLSAYVRGPVV